MKDSKTVPNVNEFQELKSFFADKGFAVGDTAQNRSRKDLAKSVRDWLKGRPKRK